MKLSNQDASYPNNMKLSIIQNFKYALQNKSITNLHTPDHEC